MSAVFSRRRVLELGAGTLAASGRSAWASVDEDARLKHILEEWQRHTALAVPLPGRAERKTLLDGKLLKTRLPPRQDAPDGAMFMVVTESSAVDLWLGSADGDHLGDGDSELVSFDLPKRGDEMFRWYGFVDLPMPFSDRHFLIRTRINPALSQSTGGRIWERTWTLERDGAETMRPRVARGEVAGVPLERFEAAIYVPANIGGWMTADLGDGRGLLAYHASTSLGGDIPDRLVNRTVYWTLGRIAESVKGLAARMPTHYSAGHPPILGGDGTVVPLR